MQLFTNVARRLRGIFWSCERKWILLLCVILEASIYLIPGFMRHLSCEYNGVWALFVMWAALLLLFIWLCLRMSLLDNYAEAKTAYQSLLNALSNLEGQVFLQELSVEMQNSIDKQAGQCRVHGAILKYLTDRLGSRSARWWRAVIHCGKKTLSVSEAGDGDAFVLSARDSLKRTRLVLELCEFRLRNRTPSKKAALLLFQLLQHANAKTTAENLTNKAEV